MQSNQEALTYLLQHIKPAGFMQITASEYSGDRLALQAPLKPNINDKGTAFAGSITSMLVLAGWGLITLKLREAGIQADVVVSDSETAYKRPVRSDMRCIAELTPDLKDAFISELIENARASIQMQSELFSNGKRCAVMTAKYVAIRT